MILRDLYCSACGHVAADIALPSLGTLVSTLYCAGCKRQTDHLPVCNGGLKTRFRQQDWPTDPAFYRGQVTVEAPEVTEVETGKPVESLRGGLVTDAPKFSDQDKRAERRDRHYHKTDVKRGTRPLYFDQRK